MIDFENRCKSIQIIDDGSGLKLHLFYFMFFSLSSNISSTFCSENGSKSRQLRTVKFAYYSSACCFMMFLHVPSSPMRPMARGLAQHGGPSSWLEESDPAGLICM
jgi:hypothetical protein